MKVKKEEAYLEVCFLFFMENLNIQWSGKYVGGAMEDVERQEEISGTIRYRVKFILKDGY